MNPSVALVGFDSETLTNKITRPLSSVIRFGSTAPEALFYVTGAADGGETEILATLDGADPVRIPVRIRPLAVSVGGGPVANFTYPVGRPILMFTSAGVVDDDFQFATGTLRATATAPVVNFAVSDEKIATLSLTRYDFTGNSVPSLLPQAPGEVTVTISVNGAVLVGPSTRTYKIQ